MADQTERPTIKVAGSEIGENRYEVLNSVIVEQSVHVPDMFTLSFADPDFEMFDDDVFTIGKEVEISFSDGHSVVVVTTGEITAISVEPAVSGRHDLVVSGLGKGHRLARSMKVRTFEEMTDADIVGQIAQDHGLSSDIDSTSATYPWLIQDQNDYAFLTERARLIGFEWWVNDSTLHFKKQSEGGAGPTWKWPDDLYSFKVRFSATEAIEEVTVRGWDATTQEAFVGTSSVKPGSDELGTSASAGEAANKAMGGFASKGMAGPAPVNGHEEAELLADSLVRRGIADEVDARGVAVGVPGVKAGGEVAISGLGDKLSGSYRLTSVDHVYRSGERYVTRFRAGGRRPSSLVDLLTNPTRRSEPDLGGRLLAGIVVSTTDPDNAGRVRVRFPSLGDDIESDWARVCAPGGGDARGLLIYPEINDEVLVAFEDGNPRRPMILGGLWSKKLLPPELGDKAIADEKVITRGWYSRLGHKVVMSDGDSDDKKSVSIALDDDATKFYLGRDEVKLDTPTPLTITGQKDITISTDANGVTINAKSITLKASSDLTLEGVNVSIKGSSGVTIEGGTTDVKAEGMLNVKAGGIASVTGSLVKLN